MAEIVIPTLHRGQVSIYRERTRLNALRCGRRFGKDIFMIGVSGDRAAKGRRVGLFAPEHKQLIEPFDALSEMLAPIRRRSSRNEGTIRTSTGGVVDFWPLNDNDLAGRGREYDDIFINEAAFTKTPSMLDIWRKSIKPTLLTRRGTAWVLSTPNGIDPENFFYECCRNPEYGFKEFHAPTSANPYVPADELEKERLTNHPLVFQQEFLAEFVDWSGVAFFSMDSMLVEGRPVAMPTICDAVFAVVDSATKTGRENDATAVTYFATTKHIGYPLVILDWDIVQIEGALLEVWLPSVLQNLERLAAACGARAGSVGTFIEDKASGEILLQQARRRGLMATAIESRLTALGKEERAISVSGYVYRGEVKFSQSAFDKVLALKGVTRNHLVAQVTGFRVGDKDNKRQDDLLDTFTYGIALALGDIGGF